MSESHTYEFNVSMSCGGCSGAIDRVLKKLDGSLPSPDPVADARLLTADWNIISQGDGDAFAVYLDTR